MGLFGRKKVEFVAPMGGRLMPVTEVPDPAFSSKMLGDGFAVDLTDGQVAAPFDGEVTAAFPTGHAYGLKRADGLECLIHIGMDTVQLEGRGFDVKVQAGDKVKMGQTLVTVDLDLVRQSGKSLISPVVFVNGEAVTLLKTGAVARGEADIVKI